MKSHPTEPPPAAVRSSTSTVPTKALSSHTIYGFPARGGRGQFKDPIADMILAHPTVTVPFGW